MTIPDPRRRHIVVLLFFVILSVPGTWPLCFELGSKLCGDGGDAYHGIWVLWWLGEAVGGHGEFFTNDLIFYPLGTSMAYDSWSLANCALALPLYWLFGLVPAFNLMVLASFFLGGWAAYLLARELGITTGPAILAGIVFAWSPYHVVRAWGHFDLVHVHWLAFFFLALLRLLRGGGTRWAVATGIFFAMATLSAYYYGLYLALAAAVLWTIQLLRRRGRPGWRWLRNSLLAVATAVVVAGPFVGPVLYTWQQEGFMETDDALYYATQYSADVAAFFTPPVYHLFFKKMVLGHYHLFMGNYVEGTVYLGFIVMVLAWLALVWGNHPLRWWLAGGVMASIVLALGPVPLWFGRMLLPVRLPYWYLAQLPLFSHQQAASRIVVFAYLGLALLAALGVEQLTAKRRPAVRYTVIVLAGLLLLADYYCYPVLMSSGTIPEFYTQLRDEAGEFSILELPGAHDARYLFYQTEHRRPMINGYISRIPKKNLDHINEQPLYAYLFDAANHYEGQPPRGRAHGYATSPADLVRLREQHVRYVLLHTDRLPELKESLTRDLNNMFGAAELFTEGILVFRVPDE